MGRNLIGDSRSAKNPGGVRHHRLRRAHHEGTGEGACAQPGVDRGCWRRGGFSLDEWGEADHRRDARYRRRLSHYRLMRNDDPQHYVASAWVAAMRCWECLLEARPR